MITDYIDLKTANVYGIYGHLGGGKTLSAVEIAVFFLRRGCTVVSNIKLRNIESLQGRYDFVEDFARSDFWQLPCGAPRGSSSPFRSAIIVDECAEFFDQYSSSSPFLKNFLSWLRHSSKRGQFVFLIVQQPEFIAKSLRLLVNKWIVCVDMAQFRLPVLRCCVPGTSNYVWRRLFDRYGNLISRGLNFGDKIQIGRYYDTAQSIALAGHSAEFDAPPDRSRVDAFLGLFRLLLFVFSALLVVALVID